MSFVAIELMFLIFLSGGKCNIECDVNRCYSRTDVTLHLGPFMQQSKCDIHVMLAIICHGNNKMRISALGNVCCDCLPLHLYIDKYIMKYHTP